MLSFPNFFNISSLNGLKGFKMTTTQKGDMFGSSIANVGDVNGDGRTDTLFGAPGANNRTGVAYLSYGRDYWYAPVEYVDRFSSEQGIKITTSSIGGEFGTIVSGGFDVNMDGINDFLISEPYHDQRDKTGGVWVFFGQEKNLPNPFDTSMIDGSNGFYIKGLSQGSITGIDARIIQDVTGDNVPDIVVGSLLENGGKGGGFIVPGREKFPAVLDLATDPSVKYIQPAPTDIEIGWGLTSFDANMDGKTDLVVGNTYFAGEGIPSRINYQNIGEVYLYYQQDKGLPKNITLNSTYSENQNLGYRIYGEHPGDMFGNNVHNIGKVSGDNREVLAFTSPYANNGAGRADFIYASKIKYQKSFNVSEINTDPGKEGFSINGVNPKQQILSISGVGDYNADGYPDFVITTNIASKGEGIGCFVQGREVFPREMSLDDFNEIGFCFNGITSYTEGSRVAIQVTGVIMLSDDVIDIAVSDQLNKAGVVHFLYGEHTADTVL